MPRGKKKAAADDDGGAGDAKKAKLSPPELDGFKVRVDWEGDEANKWTSYDQDSARAILQALENGTKTVPLCLGGTDFVIDTVKSVQKNKKTGWERRVRLCSEEKTKPDHLIMVLKTKIDIE